MYDTAPSYILMAQIHFFKTIQTLLMLYGIMIKFSADEKCPQNRNIVSTINKERKKMCLKMDKVHEGRTMNNPNECTRHYFGDILWRNAHCCSNCHKFYL